MAAEIIFRVLGFILFGIIGWLAGTVWAGTSELNSVSLRYILPLSALGGILGAVIAPWLTTRPASWLHRTIRELTAAQLLAGGIGLVMGLIIAALAALPLSSLPHPFGSILPTIVAIVFGYIGIMVMVLRQRDIFALVPAAGCWGRG